MRWLRVLLVLSALPAFGENLAFVNGRWFDGQRFVARTMYVEGQTFARRAPRRIDRSIDLGGRYVVPPYGEAHNHNVADSDSVVALIAKYLGDGIFYVKNPNSLPRVTTTLAGKINTPSSIDVTFAMGGLTSSDGHPIDIVTPRRGFKPEDGEGAFYWVVDDAAQLAAKWPSIVAGKPDFVKTYLLYSEQYAQRHGREEYRSWSGLHPSLLPEIVRRAHAAGLRVSTHVESAADFRVAVAAGVDEINHLPGFRPDRNDPKAYLDGDRYRLTAADARAAARRGITVVATITGVIAKQEPGWAEGRAIVAENLRLLRKAGVRLAVGSDSYRDTSRAEIEALRTLGVFSNAELLKMWSTSTAAAIFPARRIGKLAPGYEASFLVLDGDPLQDFSNATRINLRVKQGVVLHP